MMRLWLDVYDATGERLGPGPVLPCTSFAATARLCRAGTWQATVALDARSLALLQARRTALAWLADGDARWFVGGGVIEQLSVRLSPEGEMLLEVAGQDLIEEMNRVAIGETVIDNTLAPDPEEGTQLDQLIYNWFPPGWEYQPDMDDQPSFIHLIGYDTLLGVLSTLSDRFPLWFWRAAGESSPRVLVVTTALPTAVTLRALGNGAPAGDELTCAITDIGLRQEGTEVVSSVFAFGSGNADARLSLAAATQWPDGSPLSGSYVVDGQTLQYVAPYTSSTVGRRAGMVHNATAAAAYGARSRAVAWKDIAPISNSTVDLANAGNALLAAACGYLLAHREPVRSYDLTVAGLRREVAPGELVHVRVRKLVEGATPLVIDAALRVLEVRTQVDGDGLSTVGLVVAERDAWPQSDADALVEAIRQSEVIEALPQMSASIDTISYREPIDDDYSADLHFWLGDETTTVAQVLVRFRVDPLRSTAKSIGGTATGSVDLPDHTHGVTVPGHTHDVTVPGHTHDVTVPGHTHGVPDHDHNFTISGGAAPTYPIGFGAAGTSGGLVHNASGDDFAYPTDSDTGGTTTASGGGSTPTSSSGGSSTPTSSSGGGASLTSADGGAAVGVEVDISGALTLEYGIYEDSGGSTYGAAALEWLVNGAAATETPVSIGDGWYALDITEDVVGADGLRPAQEANVVTVRVAEASQTGKRCQVTARIQCRTAIQAIAYR